MDTRKPRRHSLRQLARRPVTIRVNGEVTIEATADGGQLVVRVWHPDDAVIARTLNEVKDGGTESGNRS